MAGNKSSNSVGTRSSRHRPSSNSHLLFVRGESVISTPKCRCDTFCVLRTAKTVVNYGRKFWGCRNFKGPHDVGCNYFDWLDNWLGNEEVNENGEKEAEIEEFDSKIEENEMLVHEKKLKIKEVDFKLQLYV
ncbi:GRF zinc finger protein [Trifolium pratense]|uniref:GRF zinc finger protein n=1 Tax=Trifolium pratense TaxID=57577 RepID=A0A2K3KQN6_TRIPR|nr:GRF zinc finger protein [Trifolium pratense]